MGAALVVGTVSIATLGSQSATAIATTIDLGKAAPYNVLAGSTATNTGPSVLELGLGVHPGTEAPGFGPGQVKGETHLGDQVALEAKDALTTAYLAATDQAADTTISTADIGNSVFKPGVHSRSGALQLTGTVTLDAEGNSDAVFLFKISSDFTLATSSTVSTINGADPCRVFWQVGSSVTMGASTTFEGTMMALTSISTESGTTVDGRLLARNGAVTLINTVFTDAACTEDAPGTDIPGTDVPGTDIPGTDIPGTDIPGTDIPGTDIPGTDIPGTDIPGTDIPGTDIPGTDTPGTDIPGTDTPGTDTPGTGTPSGSGTPPGATGSGSSTSGSGSGGSGGSNQLSNTGAGAAPLLLGAGTVAATVIGLALVLAVTRRRRSHS
ncbi:ice-binding family protein [Herbiconiux liukaitaii]|uniref:ice-binding family protein n=1 Tax=Herbiconiux liukaitaii TaxID=3342799 RepID=UPI00404519AF